MHWHVNNIKILSLHPQTNIRALRWHLERRIVIPRLVAFLFPNCHFAFDYKIMQLMYVEKQFTNNIHVGLFVMFVINMHIMLKIYFMCFFVSSLKIIYYTFQQHCHQLEVFFDQISLGRGNFSYGSLKIHSLTHFPNYGKTLI